MSAWSGLVRKEYRLGRTAALIAFLVMAVFMGFGFYMSGKTHPGILIPMSSMLLMGHMIYLPIYLGVSLQREKHTMHLWLHNPLSGNALLAAKLLNGFGALCFSLFFACLFALYAWQVNSGIVDLTVQQIWTTGIFMLIHIILASIYLGLWTLLFSMIEIVSKQKLGNWRILIILFIIFIGPRLWGSLEGTLFYNKLTHWGAIPLSDNNLLHLMHFDVVYAGIYVFHLILAALLFWISSWMLDRKVEV